jgi:hypothetical protein
MRVTIWICPSFGCGNYIGSSNAGDLTAEFSTNPRGEATFPRSRCPVCAREGRNVNRRRLDFEDGLDGARDQDFEARIAARKEQHRE